MIPYKNQSDNDLERDLRDKLLFERQKEVILFALKLNFKHLNYSHHEKAELIASVSHWMREIFDMDFVHDLDIS